MDISGNTIFIPGGTSGIGLALALRLQQAGNTVIIGGRRTEVLDRLAAEYGFGTMSIDISDPASVLSARDAVLAAHPDLNVLIAMAGIMVAEDVTKADFLENAERIVDTNVLGPVRLISAFTEHLQTRPDATIMTVSSGLAHTPLGSRRATTPRRRSSTSSARASACSSPAPRCRSSSSCRRAFAPSSCPASRTSRRSSRSRTTSTRSCRSWPIEPDATEILVERVKPLRFSEVNGAYEQAIAMVNSH